MPAYPAYLKFYAPVLSKGQTRDKNKASRIMIKKLLHCGDRKANDTIDKLKRFEVIGEYQEDRLCHPILINSDDFFKKFVSESEVNCR